MLDSLIKFARAKGASDLHLESGLTPVVRVGGELKTCAESPINAETLLSVSRKIVGDTNWPLFLEQGSYDLSTNISNVRCRINVFKTLRGVAMAIRVLSSFQPTLEKLNLIPDLLQIMRYPHGLVLISGPTGCGKSSTMAALIQEINLRQSRHIITIESPIEYQFDVKKSFIRQREVGRDTPSFYQGLVDAMREDPDVIMVGEMREPAIMRQTLNAAETGHLVISTVHSGSVMEALQRLVTAFPAEFQSGVRSQLADSLLAVVCQRLTYRPELNMRVPECEILFSNFTVKAVIREGKFFKLSDIIQTGADKKMYSFERYRKWLNQRTDWYFGNPNDGDQPADEISSPSQLDLTLQPAPSLKRPKAVKPARTTPPLIKKKAPSPPATGRRKPVNPMQEYYEIGDSNSESMEEILKELKIMKKST